MNKIRTRLILGFGMFIGILIIHAVLGQLTAKKATDTHNTLNHKLAPAVLLLSNIRIDNKELYLLVENKVSGSANGLNSNRIKEIIEVELPYYKSNLVMLKHSKESSDSTNKSIDSIVAYITESIVIVEDINRQLLTKRDFSDTAKIETIRVILNNRLWYLSVEIDNGVSLMQNKYNEALKNNFVVMSHSLKKNSQFLLWSSILFIFSGFLIAYKNTRPIVKQVKLLLESVNSIIQGNYEKRIVLKEIDEFVTLANAFNHMSDTLKTSFEEINTKNKELENFVYIASHDLQEPLRTVRSFTDLLAKDYKGQLDEKADTYIKYIAQAASRMSLLIKGLLDYSCIGGNTELSKVNCNKMLEGLKVDLSVLITDNDAKLEIDTLPTILGYKTELRLLFQNLINNAIKFHKPNVAPIIKIRSEEHSNFWKFMISDNGIGIQANKKEKIFGMFQRLNDKTDFEGSGIGLAHCAKIIELHKGRITVDSEMNIGSTFSIIISKNLG